MERMHSVGSFVIPVPDITLQSALGNWVLDLSGGNTANGTAIRLYTPNGTSLNDSLFPLAKSIFR